MQARLDLSYVDMDNEGFLKEEVGYNDNLFQGLAKLYIRVYDNSKFTGFQSFI